DLSMYKSTAIFSGWANIIEIAVLMFLSYVPASATAYFVTFSNTEIWIAADGRSSNVESTSSEEVCKIVVAPIQGGYRAVLFFGVVGSNTYDGYLDASKKLTSPNSLEEVAKETSSTLAKGLGQSLSFPRDKQLLSTSITTVAWFELTIIRWANGCL